MEIKEFKVFDSNDSHEYNISVLKEDTIIKYQLRYSANNEWTNPGQLVLEITDDGNDNIFINELGKKLDYSNLLELRLLLSVITKLDQDSQVQDKYSILEVKDVIIS